MMKSIIVDKIASVTQACGLSHELRISTDIPCEEGVVLAVEILTDKAQYNTLELTSGRMAKLARGNVVVGALGHRKALSHQHQRMNHRASCTVPDLQPAGRPGGDYMLGLTRGC